MPIGRVGQRKVGQHRRNLGIPPFCRVLPADQGSDGQALAGPRLVAARVAPPASPPPAGEGGYPPFSQDGDRRRGVENTRGLIGRILAWLAKKRAPRSAGTGHVVRAR